MIKITEKQALQAYNIIQDLVKQAWPSSERPGATQINVHPTYTKMMFELVKDVEGEWQDD